MATPMMVKEVPMVTVDLKADDDQMFDHIRRTMRNEGKFLTAFVNVPLLRKGENLRFVVAYWLGEDGKEGHTCFSLTSGT